MLLSQAQSDRAILAKQLGISEHQLSYITHSNSGEGLLFYGNVTIPFVDRFPKGEIYDLLTTRPEDVKMKRNRITARAPNPGRRLGPPIRAGWRRGDFGTKCPKSQNSGRKATRRKRRHPNSAWKARGKAGSGKGKAGKTEAAQKAGPVRARGPGGQRLRPQLCAWEDLRKRA